MRYIQDAFELPEFADTVTISSEVVQSSEPPRRAEAVDRYRFSQLRDAWIEETWDIASIHAISMNMRYQQIIGLGPVALPLILEELRDRPGHWFWALSALAGRDVAAGIFGFDAARAAWLEWGRDEGYLDCNHEFPSTQTLFEE